MSGGSGEARGCSSSKDDDELRKNSVGVDNFGRSIARIAAAQICERVGLQSSQSLALDNLADIGIRYLRDVGKIANFYANSAGRTDCNVFDIVQGLEDLGSSQGFRGALRVNNCLVGSSVIRDIATYVSVAEEIPFASPLPRFPVTRSRNLTPSFMQMGETPPGKHIPDWLPAFPDPHTYIHTPVWNERATDPRADKIEQARQRRKAEQSLLSLQQRLSRHGAEGSSSIDVHFNGGKAEGLPKSCPFPVHPLQFSEKDDISPAADLASVSNKTAMMEKPVSLLETFAPAIEAAKNGICNSEDNSRENERRILISRRPTMQFRFGIDKKSVAIPLGLNPRNPSADKMSWFLRDDERDDKKRKAEQILKESMENLHDL